MVNNNELIRKLAIKLEVNQATAGVILNSLKDVIFESLEEDNKKLLAFKQEIENKQKDELINSFYMLSDEDKKDVIANKATYSLDDIKAKLAIICFDKKVDFNLDRSSKEENNVTEKTTPITYN